MICPFVSVSKIIHNISYLIGLDKQCFIMVVDYIITNGFLQCATIAKTICIVRTIIILNIEMTHVHN